MATNSRAILLIGRPEQAFINAGDVKLVASAVHENVLDGIEAAAEGSFCCIAVVIEAVTDSTAAALKALREADGSAKIILLARMHEEPAAIELVNGCADGRALADDYLICPLHSSHLEALITDIDKANSQGLSGAGLEHVKFRPGQDKAVDDLQKDEKIRLLEKLATEDELTALKNRRYIRQFCRQIIERAEKENGHVTILVFDIDNFKHYNDVYGHRAGDEILKQAAVLIRRCCRRHDVVGRIGGDEFAVIFWDLPRTGGDKVKTERRSTVAGHPKEVLFIAKRFSQEFQKAELSLLGPEGKGVLTISGGLAGFPEDGKTTEQLFDQADKALLEAKRSGKNRIYLVGQPENDISRLGD